MTFFTVFFQMLALLIMIGAGYLAARIGMMDEHTNNQMSDMIVNVFNPLLIFSSAANAVGQISLEAMWRVGLIAAGMFLVFIIAGMILSPIFEKDLRQRKIFQLMVVFSNVGFIGVYAGIYACILYVRHYAYRRQVLGVLPEGDGKSGYNFWCGSYAGYYIWHTGTGVYQDCGDLSGQCNISNGIGSSRLCTVTG